MYEKDRDTLVEQLRIVLEQHLLIGMATKNSDTLIEQSLFTKYSNRAAAHACKLEILQLNFIDAKQNLKMLSRDDGNYIEVY